MVIKNVEIRDIPEALNLVWEVFQEFEKPDYSEQGIVEFRKFLDIDEVTGKIERGELVMKGSYDGTVLTGVIAVRNSNHISLLFVHKNYHRRGIARSLVESVVKDCRKAGYAEITVNSSPFAVEAYHHLGFVDTDVEQTVNGIRFTPMVKNIT
jgi:GNAT superfamily N-acetyltransferase